MRATGRIPLQAPLALALAAALGGCSGGGGQGEPVFDPATLWVRYAVESEVGRGAIAYATYYDRDEEGEALELPADARLTCYGRQMDLTIEAWTGVLYYKAVVPDLGAAGRYAFALTPAGAATLEDEVVLPSAVEIDGATSSSEVQPGQDVTFALSAGEADELDVAVVATCLAEATASLPGDATSATIPGDAIRCACEAGGLVPPCDGLLRAQRVSRGAVSEGFAGGETLGVQRHEVDVSVIPE